MTGCLSWYSLQVRRQIHVSDKRQIQANDKQQIHVSDIRLGSEGRANKTTGVIVTLWGLMGYNLRYRILYSANLSTTHKTNFTSSAQNENQNQIVECHQAIVLDVSKNVSSPTTDQILIPRDKVWRWQSIFYSSLNLSSIILHLCAIHLM